MALPVMFTRSMAWLDRVLAVLAASTFILGGLASMALAFREQTWPLRLSRVMLGVVWTAIGGLILRYYHRK